MLNLGAYWRVGRKAVARPEAAAYDSTQERRVQTQLTKKSGRSPDGARKRRRVLKSMIFINIKYNNFLINILDVEALHFLFAK
jgi:hypothetical protein